MKNISHNHNLTESFKSVSDYKLYYFRAVQYWFKVLNKEPIFEEDGINIVTGEMKTIYAENLKERNAIISILSSNIFFLYYIIWSSCQVVNIRDFNFNIFIKGLKPDIINTLSTLGINLQKSYQENSKIIERKYSKKGRIFSMKKQHFYIKHSKLSNCSKLIL